MTTFLALFTYFAYIFIVAMYTKKAVKFLRLPTHIRWELYPIPHEENYAYGGSVYEHADSWTKTRQKHTVRSIAFFLKEYLTFGSYFRWQKSYWFFLYICHAGFVMLMVFQGLSFWSALTAVLGVTVSAASDHSAGRTLYYLVPASGVISFICGLIGSAGLFAKRIGNEDLKAFASPETYFGYIFNLLLSVVGLYAWHFTDPFFSQYRGFWEGLITLRPVSVEPVMATLVFLLALHLIYLPFTRAFHYISRIFAYFLIRWEDEPNLRGSRLEKTLDGLLEQNVTWSAPHIESGKKWKELTQSQNRGEPGARKET